MELKVIETKVLKIWKSILGENNIQKNKSFFDYSGNSIKALLLVSKLNEVFNTSLIITDIFEYLTIEKLSFLFLKKTNQNNENITCIAQAPEIKYYDLTSSQTRIWLLSQNKESSIAYNNIIFYRIEGKLNIEKFINSIKKIISRHKILRTIFIEVNNIPKQKEIEINLSRHIVLTVLSYADKSDVKFMNLMHRDARIEFNLSEKPPFFIRLTKIKDNRFIFSFIIHHIISDGYSFNIFFNELLSFYNNELKDKLDIQFPDYAFWENNQTFEPAIINYWDELLKEHYEPLNLIYDFKKNNSLGNVGKSIYFNMDKDITTWLKGYSKKNSTTVFVLLLGIFNILLMKLTGQQKICIGTPTFGRLTKQTRSLIGMFVNTLPIINNIRNDITFSELINDVKNNFLNALKYQNYPYEKLLNFIPNNNGELINVLIASQQEINAFDRIENVQFTKLNIDKYTSIYPIYFDTIIGENKIECKIEYNTKLFKKETIKNYILFFITICKSLIVNDGDIYIADIDMIDRKERIKLIDHLKINYVNEQKIHCTVQEQFEKQVILSRDKIALKYKDKEISYKQLDYESTQLAKHIQRIHPKADFIGILTPNPYNFILSIFGILKAGYGIFPIDISLPIERIKFQIDNSRIDLIVSQYKYCKNIINEVTILDIGNKSDEVIDSEIQKRNNWNDGLYLIYTSGSTGLPKGVILNHKNILNLVYFQYDYTNIEFKSVLQFASRYFDVAYQEIFSTLLYGGTLTLIDDEIKTDIEILFSIVEQNKIESIFLPSAFIKTIFNDKYYCQKMPKCIRHIIAAGEQLIIPKPLKEALKNNGIFLHNHYGPSETHVVATLTINPKKNIPDIPSIGKSISNTSILILNETKKIQPNGVAGEIHIAGSQVGKGYFNNQKLTNEKYIENPFKDIALEENRIYCTGDIGRYLSDGNIDFLGRKDQQIKLRGYRIELSEIEIAIQNYPTISKCVIKKYDDEKPYLCAYYVSEEEIGQNQLKSFARKTLPSYMVPEIFMKIDKIPTNRNGKVSYNDLPNPSLNNLEKELIEPSSELETILMDIWKEIFKKDAISLDTTFYELGGHSLIALKLISKINSKLNLNLKTRIIFERDTVKSLSISINGLLQEAK